jgi:outer membrane receptor protein involved in Fe transport
MSGYSQNSGTINGKVSDGNHPIEFANVLLSTVADTSKVIQYALTDTDGSFVIENIVWGEYQVQVRIIGYNPVTRKITVTRETAVQNFDNIILQEDVTMLAQVTITGQRKFIQKTPQGFVINAASNITQIGGTATDLFRNAPTIAVDAEGGITLRGKTPLILINGRNSAMTNLEQIAASSIESVEIMTHPSAKYDAAAESGIINIILKKNMGEGFNGAIASGVGMGAKGRVNSMVMLNYKHRKWNVGLSYDNRFAGRIRNDERNRTNFELPDEYYLNQSRSDERVDRLQNLKFNADFTPNEKNSFSFETIGNTRGEDNYETLYSTWVSQLNVTGSMNKRYSKEIRRSKTAEFAMTYNRKFDDDRKKLSVIVSTSIEQGRENTDITTQAMTGNHTLTGEPFLQRTHNYENGNRYNAILDYAFPITANAVVETGYKGVFRKLDADFQTSEMINNVYEVNTNSSNIFYFREQVHAAYVQFNAFIGSDEASSKWKYSGGMRAEQVFNDGNTQNNSTTFENQYVKFFPSAHIVYYPKPDEFLKLGYAKRINYPGSGQLNPFVDITDALTQHSGNPFLKPEIIHSFEFGYNKYWNKYTVSSTLFYRHSLNTIKLFYELKPDGAIIYYPQNFGKAYTYGIENVFFAKPLHFYNLNMSLSLFEQRIDGTDVAGDISNDAFCWYGKLINNFVFWHESKLQIIGSYNSSIVTPQGKTIAVYNVDLGFQKRLGNRNAHIGLVVTDIFNMLKSGDIQNTPSFSLRRSSKSDTRAVLLTFAWTFNSTFKEKLLENKFDAEF